MPSLLRMVGITKIYDNGATANDHVSIDLRASEIHAVAGENGAGKSTVMKILYGLVKKDSGEIYFDGVKVHIHSPQDAMKLGIGMVHQHFMLVNRLPVYQNIFLGHESRRMGFLNKQEMIDQTEALCAKYGMQVDPFALCGTLSVGEAQKVEILKALSRGVRLLILDEPTAVLTPQEIKELFAQLRLLKQGGCTVVIITHKLKEILELCDRVSIMRAGRTVGEYPTEGMDEKKLGRLMIGRDVESVLHKEPTEAKESVLQVRGLTVKGAGGKPAVRNISFDVKKGEILCLAGVEGNGQREIVRSVTGLDRKYEGEILFDGMDLKKASVKKARGHGLSHIPEDRMALGVNKDAHILDNLISLDFGKNSRFGFIRYKALGKDADARMKDYAVKAASNKQKIGMLSGGNIQKVVVAREMNANPSLLVADQPTRGVDVGAMELIHKKLIELRDKYGALLLVSADMSEVMGLSDRILVFHEGEIMAEITDVPSLTEEQLGKYMLGIDRQEGGGEVETK
jgi:simple sugar transport system ATP-binding protein